MATRDLATFEHAKRVRRYATALATKSGLGDPDLLRAIETAALFHDVGKLAIPDRLLDKPGPLTPDEYDQVKQHAAIGADMLSGLSLPGPLALLVRHHHENWDGTGYPGPPARRRHSRRCARARDRRLLRRADLGSTVSPRHVVTTAAMAMMSRAARHDVRPADDGRVPADRPGAATRLGERTAVRAPGRLARRVASRQVRDEERRRRSRVLSAAGEGARVRRGGRRRRRRLPRRRADAPASGARRSCSACCWRSPS